MANTVPILNFTNTFGDLLAQQNRQSVELNNLAANNYTKDSGTLILNGAGTGLSVTDAAILGSSIVSRTLSVIGDATALSNVYINGSGFTLDVANSAIIRQNIITNQITANTLIRATTINASGNVFANDISSNNLIRTTTLTASGNAIVNTLQSNTIILGATLNITGQALTNSLQSNTSIGGSTLVISSSSITNTLQANSSVNTAIVTATQNIIGGNIQANTGLSSTTLSVSGLSSVNSLQANSSVNTAIVTATQSITGGNIQANTGLSSTTLSVSGLSSVNSLQANSSVNTATITATNSITGSNIQANTGLSSPTLSVSGTTRTGVLIANTSITVPTLTVSTKLDANSATEAYFQNIQTTGQVIVGGDFVINGATVYNSNTFIINANSATGAISTFGVNRGSSGANAEIRWNESADYFDILNVNNGIYNRVLTNEYLSSSTTLDSTSNVATSAAVLQLQNVCNTQNTRLSSIETINNNQNTSITIIQGVDATQNIQISGIQGVDLAQNASITIIQGVDSTQNTRLNSIETINNNQNTTITIIQGVDATQNTQIAGIQGVDLAQNNAITIIQGVDSTQNTRLNSIETINNNQNTTITQVNQYAASGYGLANTINSTAAFKSGTTFTGPVQAPTASPGTSNTQIATTEFVNNLANSGTTFAHSITGNAGTVTNGVVTTGSYTNPSWIVSLPSTKITGLAASATTDTTSATNISSGTLASARISGSYTGITGVGTLAAGSIPTTLITGLAASATTDTTSATNISSGTLASARLGTAGTPQFDSLGVGTSASGTSGEIRATGDVVAYYSDDNLKTRIGNIENALGKVMTLNGFYYEANETAQALGYKVKREVGLSAQEVQAVLPEIVVPAPIDDQYLTIHYEKVIPLLVEAIKELQREVQELKKK